MPKQSAGILLYRFKNKLPEIFLCHPGGPFYKSKDLGSWSLPKGEFDENEDPLEAAKREFKEEIGQEIKGEFIPLKPVKYKSGKIIYAWALRGDIDPGTVKSNLFSLEWPPRSGKFIDVPEVDRAEWFDINVARKKILPAQSAFIDDLVDKIST